MIVNLPCTCTARVMVASLLGKFLCVCLCCADTGGETFLSSVTCEMIIMTTRIHTHHYSCMNVKYAMYQFWFRSEIPILVIKVTTKTYSFLYSLKWKSTKVQTLGANIWAWTRYRRTRKVSAHVKQTCNGKYTEKTKDGDPYIWL